MHAGAEKKTSKTWVRIPVITVRIWSHDVQHTDYYEYRSDNVISYEYYTNKPSLLPINHWRRMNRSVFRWLQMYNGTFTWQVLLHNPYDYPNDYIEENVLSAGRMMLVSVYPEKFQTTSGARRMSVSSRHCLLRNERVLRSLRHFSYSNCFTECRQNFSTHLCGCSPFYYPNNGKEQFQTLHRAVWCVYQYFSKRQDIRFSGDEDIDVGISGCTEWARW